MEEDILPAKALAEILDIPHIEVIRRIRRGDIKARKIGWGWFINVTHVDEVKKSDWYKKRLARQAQQSSLS